MATRKASALRDPEGRQFWQKAFTAGCRLMQPHDGDRLPAAGAAHWAADFADFALEEFRRRWGDRR